MNGLSSATEFSSSSTQFQKRQAIPSSTSSALVTPAVTSKNGPLAYVPVALSSHSISLLDFRDIIAFKNSCVFFNQIYELYNWTCNEMLDLARFVKKMPRTPPLCLLQFTFIRLDVEGLNPIELEKLKTCFRYLLLESIRLQYVRLVGTDLLPIALEKAHAKNPRFPTLSLHTYQDIELGYKMPPFSMKTLFTPRKEDPKRLDDFRKLGTIANSLALDFLILNSTVALPKTLLSLERLHVIDLGYVTHEENNSSLFDVLGRCQHLRILKGTIPSSNLQLLWSNVVGRITTLSRLILSLDKRYEREEEGFGFKILDEKKKKEEETKSTTIFPDATSIAPNFTHLTDLTITVESEVFQRFWEEFIVTQLPSTSVRSLTVNTPGLDQSHPLPPLSLPPVPTLQFLSFKIHVNLISAIWNGNGLGKMPLEECSLSLYGFSPLPRSVLPSSSSSLPARRFTGYPEPLFHLKQVKHFTLTCHFGQLETLESIRNFVSQNILSITTVHLICTHILFAKTAQLNFVGDPTRLGAYITEWEMEMKKRAPPSEPVVQPPMKALLQ